MKRYHIQRTIAASPEAIWAILTEAAAYPDWNESVTKVEGTIAQGQKIKVFAKISPNRAFPVRVAELTAPSRMVWTGGMPMGLFKGVRTFTLTPSGEGQTNFEMEEVFSGAMSPLILRSMPDLTESFAQFADGLKRRAESHE